nr:hypothetical protein [Pediococcus pentosaceus]
MVDYPGYFFSTPITIPLALGLFMAIFGVIFGIVVAILGVGLAFTIFGIIAIIIFIIGLTLLATSFWTGIYYIGFGLLVIGIYLILIPFIRWILMLILHGTSLFFRWLYTKIVTRRTEKRGDR